jgi:hypothetical protein
MVRGSPFGAQVGEETHPRATTRERVALVAAVLVIGAVGGWLAARGNPGRPPLVVTAALVAIGLLAYFNAVKVARYFHRGALAGWLSLDASAAVSLIALAAVGPWLALALALVSELLWWAGEGRHSELHKKAANVASYAAAAFAGAELLALLGHPAGHQSAGFGATAALALAGMAYILVNYFVTRGLVAMLADRQSVLATIRRELIPALPSVVIVVLIAALSAALVAAVGQLGLLPLMLAVVAPQLVLGAITVLSPPADRLSVAQASVRYADALADQLQLPRRQRRIIAAASRGEWGIPRSGLGLGNIWYGVGQARFYRHERYDGSGPLGIHGRWIPLESRVLALAQAWAELTAKQTLALAHREALARLEQCRGAFDPGLVAAARDVVAAHELEPAGPERAAPARGRHARTLARLVGATAPSPAAVSAVPLPISD